MFHDGSLQSGISRAIQEKKVVACFVRDDGDESTTWEKEWLQHGWISSLLEQKTVLLRIEAGSTEAGFLSAFCPVTIVPTFILIEDGQLREQLVSGISQDDFINTIRTALGASAIPNVSSPSNATPREASTPVQARTLPPSRPAPAPAAPAQAPALEQHIPVSPILPPSSKAKGKQKVNSPEPKSEKVSKAQQSARDALRKKKQEEKEELARIQARIEADKTERRAQAEARKAERERERLSSPTSASPALNSTSIKGSQAKEVHLNVRLFDGRTIRSTFPRTAKLQDDVRPWIDREFIARAEDPGEKHPPYFFKQILAPLPSRELSAGDESETLGDIDLAPSATLVLIPVKGYTEAYSGGGGGLVGGVVGGVTGLVGGVFGLAYNAAGYVGSTIGSVVGLGAGRDGSAAQAATQSSATGAADRRPGTPSDPGMRVRTLADQREREPRNQELYNGNQLNFEPNDDESNSR